MAGLGSMQDWEYEEAPCMMQDASCRLNRFSSEPLPVRCRIAFIGVALVSATQAQALDERAVTLDLDTLQVLEHPATLTDEEQQTTT